MLASWRAQAGMAGGAARGWEDPGEGEEPVAGVWAGASGHRARMAPSGR